MGPLVWTLTMLLVFTVMLLALVLDEPSRDAATTEAEHRLP